MTKDLAILTATAFSDADAATPPERFLLVKWGRTEYTKDGKGGHIDFSEADADAIIAEFAYRSRGHKNTPLRVKRVKVEGKVITDLMYAYFPKDEPSHEVECPSCVAMLDADAD